MDQAPCGPAVPCLSRQARAAVMVRLRGEADAGHRSAVIGHRSPVKQVIGRQCHSGVSVIRVNTGMVNFRKFLLPNKAVIFLKIFREIYICPKTARCSTRRSASVDRARQADCGLRESGRRSNLSGADAAGAGAGGAGADAAAGAARLCDSAHRARRWNLTRWAASRAAAVAARGWRRWLEAVVDFEFI